MAYAKSPSRKKAKNGNDLDARVSALKGDFDSLQNNVRELLSSLGHEASSGLANATEAAGDAAEQVGSWSEAGAESVRGAIRTQPLAAIALSMGAGALIGSLLRR